MNKTKQLQEGYNKLEKDIEKLQTKERNLYKKLKEKGHILIEIRKNENSRLEKNKGIVPELEFMIKALTKYKYNKNLICNHFGVYSYTPLFSIRMSGRKGKIQIVLEVRNKWVAHEEVGLTKKAWDEIRKLIKDKFALSSYWNGGEDHYSMTLVLKNKAPTSLLIALKNYDVGCSKGRGFPTDNFGVFFERNLKKTKGVKK